MDSGKLRAVAQCLSMCPLIPSGPGAFLDLTLLRNEKTVDDVILKLSKFE